MTAVNHSDGTAVNQTPTSESPLKIWISPATMDSGDTVVLPTITDKTVRILACFDATTGDSVTATLSTQTVTIDAAGGTTNHVYHLLYTYV